MVNVSNPPLSVDLLIFANNDSLIKNGLIRSTVLQKNTTSWNFVELLCSQNQMNFIITSCI